jgi:hypothetical protein
MRLSTPSIVLLNDQAIFRRTPAGQRELLATIGRLAPLERQFLSATTGYTPLRVLLDMGLDQPGIGDAIMNLAERRLICLEHPQGGG